MRGFDAHAIGRPPYSGARRHTRARWYSHFNANEQGVGRFRRKLEQAERDGSFGPKESLMTWATKARLIDTYNTRARECPALDPLRAHRPTD